MELKTALITGASSGIGFKICKQLLKCNIKLQNLSMIDIDEGNGQNAIRILKEMFQDKRIIFIKTDVTNKQEFEDAFVKTIENFGTVDILVNGAGILNDKKFALEIAVNLTSAIHGIMLGFKYIGKSKNPNGGTIINISSIAGLDFFSICPVYSATKLGIVGLARSYGQPFHFKRTGVQVMALCPGDTKTPFSDKIHSGIEEEFVEEFLKGKSLLPLQPPEAVAKAVVHIIQFGENGSIWSVENSQLYELAIPDRRTFSNLIVKNI